MRIKMKIKTKNELKDKLKDVLQTFKTNLKQYSNVDHKHVNDLLIHVHYAF